MYENFVGGRVFISEWLIAMRVIQSHTPGVKSLRNFPHCVVSQWKRYGITNHESAQMHTAVV